MSKTKIDNFVKEPIKVFFKKNIDLSYFKNNGFCDYRIGCDLCKKGDCYGFKTNILNFKDSFILNELDIDKSICDPENKIYLQNFYETDDCILIKNIYDIFNKMNEKHGNERLFYEYDIIDQVYTGSWIQSIFEKKNIKDIKNIKICSICYLWITSSNINKFSIINPFKYFWIDVINNYMDDIIEFDDIIIKNKYF